MMSHIRCSRFKLNIDFWDTADTLHVYDDFVFCIKYVGKLIYTYVTADSLQVTNL
jgi:hypothetical protein